MKLLANAITAFVVFLVLALVIVPMDPEFGRGMIYTGTLTAITILAGIYFWQPDQALGQLDTRKSLLMFVVLILIYVPILLIVSLVFAHLNPFVPEQWYKFRTALTYFFVATIGPGLFETGAILILPVSFATLIRALTLDCLSAISSGRISSVKYK
jgi:hypothetical protein